jgi:polysaccharide biosynthesis transport protein
MENDQSEQTSSGLGANDILFMLFRRKWVIAIAAVIGLVSAVVAYFAIPPVYESQAKLLVRYVVERSAIDSVDSQPRMVADNIINSEVEILTSRDLAASVVDAITVERLFPGAHGNVALANAVSVVQKGLIASPLKGSNIIRLSYKHGDPALTTTILDELVQHYLAKHLEVHRSLGAFEFVTKQSDKIKLQLSQTEEELKRLKAKEGIISLAESSNNLNTELTSCLNDLRLAETELAEQKARVTEMEKWVIGEAPTGTKPNQAPRDTVQQYQALSARIAKLRQAEFEVMTKYTSESSMAVRTRSQLAEAEEQRRNIEKKFPSLAMTATASTGSEKPATDILSERARLASIEAKCVTLRERLTELRGSVNRLSEVGPQINQLERKRGIDEETYKYYQASLEKARIDEALDPSKMPNISVVQKPSTAIRVSSEFKKKLILGLMAGGLAGGIALALLMELFVDRSVKRPLEFETQLRIPMLSWIPLVEQSGSLLLQSKNKRSEDILVVPEDTATNLAPWEPGHFIRSFSEEIRDRLLLFFELKNLTHKPKLVAVTSCSHGAGTSTIAGGLATALSNTGDGRVLLVDMNKDSALVHPFFEGLPICSLSDALESKGTMCAAAENLYLATAALPLNDGTSLSPRSFYNMVPQFHASDFDYVVFDLPPLDQSSSALAIARFMDKILLVVESEKINRESVQRSYAELRAANPNASAVLNKTRSYTPKWLGFEN